MAENYELGAPHIRAHRLNQWLGCSKSQSYRVRKQPGFPQPRKLGGRFVIFDVAELRQWLDSKATQKG